ncbi:MAG: undecaprenyl/decaprenyl-phosphate alpha-N-acetylglucosaminyl 1-phosphate transferase [Alistipes sp.]|nr:undecaprenyl/decaprenyl-phosphate alpha-N-acetylglucosaminyl 1-phosphate transferase [Alistipes sp.]
MTMKVLLAIAFLVSLVLVAGIHSRVVKFAVKHKIVDKPGSRKLQKEPVPVLGGVAVFCGVTSGLIVAGWFAELHSMWFVVSAMLVMLVTGLWDDIRGLSPWFRLLVEIGVVLCLIFFGGFCIDDFHGLCGIREIPYHIAVPLTVFAAVGIINAINLIDGVNGLSSGFCVMACAIFGTFFYRVGNLPMALLAAVSAGALIPFFLHNVFGRTSRMFIGDSGTLAMGVVMSVFVCEVLGNETSCSLCPRYGLIPFTLAVLSIPVFDTLRVMLTRMWHGISPFHADRTHLHHVFIAMGCSHPMTTLAMLTLDLGVVICWWVLSSSGVSIDVQFVVVVGLSVLCTFGLYNFVAYHLRHKTCLMRRLRRLGFHTHLSRSRFFLALRKFVDRY